MPWLSAENAAGYFPCLVKISEIGLGIADGFRQCKLSLQRSNSVRNRLSVRFCSFFARELARMRRV